MSNIAMSSHLTPKSSPNAKSPPESNSNSSNQSKNTAPHPNITAYLKPTVNTDLHHQIIHNNNSQNSLGYEPKRQKTDENECAKSTPAIQSSLNQNEPNSNATRVIVSENNAAYNPNNISDSTDNTTSASKAAENFVENILASGVTTMSQPHTPHVSTGVETGSLNNNSVSISQNHQIHQFSASNNSNESAANKPKFIESGIQTDLYFPDTLAPQMNYLTAANQGVKKSEYDALQSKLIELESKNKSLASLCDSTTAMCNRSGQVLKHLLIEKSELERKKAQVKTADNNIKLGQYVMQRYGSSYSETWQAGSRVKELTKY